MTCKLLSSIDVIRCNVCIYGLISIPYTTLQKHLALLNTIHPIPGYKTWNRNVVLAVLISWRTCKLAGAPFRSLWSHTVMSMYSRVLVFEWKVIPPPIMTHVRLQGLQSARSARPVFAVVHFLGASVFPYNLHRVGKVFSIPISKIISFSLLHGLTGDIRSVYLCWYWILHVVLLLFQLLEHLRLLLSDLLFLPIIVTLGSYYRTWKSYQAINSLSLMALLSNLQLSKRYAQLKTKRDNLWTLLCLTEQRHDGEILRTRMARQHFWTRAAIFFSQFCFASRRTD